MCNMGIILVLTVKGGCEEQHVLAITVHPYFTDEDAEVQRGAMTCSNLLSKSVLSQALLPGLLI